MIENFFFWFGLVAFTFMVFLFLAWIYYRLPKRLRIFIENLFTFPAAMWLKIGEGKARDNQRKLIENGLTSTWEKRIFARWWMWWFNYRITFKEKKESPKIPTTCYVCEHFEDRRAYWCNKMDKEISGIADRIPDECPLKTKS